MPKADAAPETIETLGITIDASELQKMIDDAIAEHAPGPHVTLSALEAQADELKLAIQGWEGQRAQAAAALREAEAKILSHNGALEIVSRLIVAAQAGPAA